MTNDVRLIDANALKEVIETYRPIKCFTDKDIGKNRMVDYCLSEIDNAPTVKPELPKQVNTEFGVMEQPDELSLAYFGDIKTGTTRGNTK